MSNAKEGGALARAIAPAHATGWAFPSSRDFAGTTLQLNAKPRSILTALPAATAASIAESVVRRVFTAPFDTACSVNTTSMTSQAMLTSGLPGGSALWSWPRAPAPYTRSAWPAPRHLPRVRRDRDSCPALLHSCSVRSRPPWIPPGISTRYKGEVAWPSAFAGSGAFSGVSRYIRFPLSASYAGSIAVLPTIRSPVGVPVEARGASLARYVPLSTDPLITQHARSS